MVMENEPIEQHTTIEEEKPAATPPVTAEPKPPALPQDWQQTTQPVFVVEDSFYRSRTPPRPVHWSIAWSDLMMTMFILFLTLFAHLRTHQEILAHGKPNKIADETIPVRSDDAKPSLIFHPISQDVSLKTSDKLQEKALPEREQSGADVLIRHQAVEEKPQDELLVPIPEVIQEQHDPKTPSQVATAPALRPTRAPVFHTGNAAERGSDHQNL